ncbi:hypothetical protein LR48_Vigan01g052400 [Vigna angularis]|uniref:Uncharacterized protein n=1 Tax=Phaseolus angularis TaxID=3914 RepID=A0A0L9TLG3_PHAAN|nr:hypothetical protein LR48_Vigan01g052400 [Vigna angularis]
MGCEWEVGDQRSLRGVTSARTLLPPPDRPPPAGTQGATRALIAATYPSGCRARLLRTKPPCHRLPPALKSPATAGTPETADSHGVTASSQNQPLRHCFQTLPSLLPGPSPVVMKRPPRLKHRRDQSPAVTGAPSLSRVLSPDPPPPSFFNRIQVTATGALFACGPTSPSLLAGARLFPGVLTTLFPFLFIDRFGCFAGIENYYVEVVVSGFEDQGLEMRGENEKGREVRMKKTEGVSTPWASGDDHGCGSEVFLDENDEVGCGVAWMMLTASADSGVDSQLPPRDFAAGGAGRHRSLSQPPRPGGHRRLPQCQVLFLTSSRTAPIHCRCTRPTPATALIPPPMGWDANSDFSLSSWGNDFFLAKIVGDDDALGDEFGIWVMKRKFRSEYGGVGRD